MPLDLSSKPLALAKTLEALEHLLNGFVAAWPDPDHENTFFIKPTP